ncbi:MAG TPA: PKD domain-containing protein, partial [Bacteroidia bacterium]|nr:PKD domain-containing protein [Bacteroidia bacterium]
YMGQDVMIRFTAAGCIFAGHYAYAYVDASCLPYSISTSDSLCVGNSITLSAPVGAASYLWNTNDTTQSITISTPGSYSVSMMSVTGCQTLLTQNVGIYPEPTAAFNPTYVPCGLTYTFNDSSSVASGTLSYHWDFGIPSQTGDTSNLSNPVFTYPGIGTHTVTLVVLTNNGCVDSATMIVYPGNGGQAAFSATTECAGNATMFTDQSTGTSAWSWNFGDTASGANDSSNVQHPTHIFTASGTYTVTLLVNTVPCPSLISHVITVDPVPVAAMSYSQICGAQNATFNSSSTVGYPGTIVLHEWDFGDPGSGANNTSQLTNPSHSFSGPGVYTVMLVVTTDAGCSDTTTMALNVGPGPIANFTTTSVCTGTQMQFNNTSANTAAWYWNFGVGSTLADTSNLENPTYLYTNPGSYVVTLIGNPGPCADSYTQTVTVFPMPVAQFTAPLVCYGYPTIFTDQSIVSSGSIASWNWDFGVSTSNGDTSSVQNPNYIYPVGATYTVSLTVTSNNGCSATDTVVVNVAQLPVANFASDVVCVGYPVTFTDLSTANSGNLTTWTWDFGDGSPPDYQQHPVHPYPSEGTYNVTLVVTTSFGCIDTIVLPAVTDAMPVIAFLADTLAGCPTLCVEFSDMTTIASGNVTSWEWDFGDSTVPVYQQNPSHCFSITGLYDITLTATSAGGCSTTLVINDMIEVYPEPHASFLATPPLTTVVQPHIEFTDISTGTPVKWQWDFGDPTTLGDTSGIPYPSYTYSNEYGTTYNVWLTVTNSYGCVDDTMLQVLVEPEFTFFIPNAFTPNNDGKNDLFFGTGIGINKYEIWIFDRWGNMIWNSKDMNEGWPGIVQGSSGDICQEDVYVWKVIVTDVWNKKHKFIGHVSLIR